MSLTWTVCRPDADPQNIKPPLDGDDAAIKKYASEMEALRKKVPGEFFA